MTAHQLDLYPSDATAACPLLGMTVKLDNTRGHQCCPHNDLATIGAGKGPHYAELLCKVCGGHRGWLTKDTANWITRVIKRFGAPEEFIALRRHPELHAQQRVDNPPDNAGTSTKGKSND